MSDKENASPETKSPSSKTKERESPSSPSKSPLSRKSSQGSAKPSSGPGSAKTTSASKKKGNKKPEKKPADGENAGSEKGLPEGCFPIALLNQTQEIFGCVIDEHVSEENPIKILRKEDIVNDLRARAAVSDFSPLKQKIFDYDGDEILIFFDFDFRHGENFCIALTEEAKVKILTPPKVDEVEQQSVQEEEEEEIEVIVPKYEPPIPKPWVPLGSEIEIRDEVAFECREKINIKAIRIRRDFGQTYNFTDDGPSRKTGYAEYCKPEEGNFDLHRMELDKFIQAIPTLETVGTQTDWKQPRNACTQYIPRTFSEEEIVQTEEIPNYLEFIKKVTPRFEQALQQNEIMDIFFDDWKHLGDNIDMTINQAVNQLREYQSFCDLKFSKDKAISCIQWHPTIRGIIAFSAAENKTFDERIDHSHRILLSPSLILIWSFTDPIHPQLLLQAPEDIYCFQFNPTDTNIVVGGCINGQVVLWDISQYINRLKMPKGGQKKNTTYLPGFEDASFFETPIVRYCALSSIEFSHVECITDICWVPDHIDINRFGVVLENRDLSCSQLITCAVDNQVLVWDIRSPGKLQHRDSEKTKKSSTAISGIPDTYRFLDLSWKPMLKINLNKSEAGADFSPTKFSISEIQGDKSSLTKKDENKGEDYMSKPGSGKDKKVLQAVNTHFYVGTEIGELLYIDWMPHKDSESGKLLSKLVQNSLKDCEKYQKQFFAEKNKKLWEDGIMKLPKRWQKIDENNKYAAKPEFCHTYHDGPICALKRSPFNKNVLLVVGGWNFSLWKEGVTTGPLLQSSYMSHVACDGCWSPTRPSVFYIARKDGTIDVWDVMDKTHEPFLSQNITPFCITSIAAIEFSHKRQLLAIGDNSGTLHVLEVPWSLRTLMINEVASFNHYIERETKRQAFVVNRWNLREQEKRQKELEKKNVIRRPQYLSEEENEQKLKSLYNAYLEEEASVLRTLGLKTEETDLPEK